MTVLTVAVMMGVLDWEWIRDFLLRSALIHCYCLPKAMGEKCFQDKSWFSRKETGAACHACRGVENFLVLTLLQGLTPHNVLGFWIFTSAETANEPT